MNCSLWLVLYSSIILCKCLCLCLFNKSSKWNETQKEYIVNSFHWNNESMLLKRKRFYAACINNLQFLKNISCQRKRKRSKYREVVYFRKMDMYDEKYTSYLKKHVIDENILKQKEKEENQKNGEKENDIINKEIEIHIRNNEKLLFNILKQVNETYNLKSTLRVVGGWVRDKHLKIVNSDIDITIDNMKGAEFCEYVKKYIEEKSQGKETFNFRIIKINSDQSKHLETASFNLLDFQIDIVNLRSEKYTENSRIPEIVIGTPEEDAYRRDFTVNSLFYNLQNQKIEDFTNKGIFHLKHKIISTPLEPLTTFLDDPLRIIRCIRFCGYLNFYMEKAIFDIIKNEQIKKAFSKKISKSRLSAELIKLFSFKCKNVIFCLTLLNYSSYSSIIFQLPDKCFIKNGWDLCDNILENGRKRRKTSAGITTTSNTSSSDDNMSHALTEKSYDVKKETTGNNPKDETIMHSDKTKQEKKKIFKIEKEHMQKWMFHGLQCLIYYKENEQNILTNQFPRLDYKDNKDFLNLGVFFLPLHNYLYFNNKLKKEYVVEYVVKESLKFPLKYAKFYTYIFDGFEPIQQLYNNHQIVHLLQSEKKQQKENSIKEKENATNEKENTIKEKEDKNIHPDVKASIVLFLKKVGDKWDILLFLFYIFQKYKETTNEYSNYDITTNGHNDHAEKTNNVKNNTIIMNLSDFAWKLYHLIIKHNLQNSYKIKPFLKWPDIKDHFPNISSNKINEVYDHIVRYMVIYGENKENCIEYLKKHFNKYT